MGSKNVEDRVREEIKNTLETHQPKSLPDSVVIELTRIKDEGEKELTSKQS